MKSFSGLGVRRKILFVRQSGGLQFEIQLGGEAGNVDGGVGFDANGWQVKGGQFGNRGKRHVDTDVSSAHIQDGEDWKKLENNFEINLY